MFFFFFLSFILLILILILILISSLVLALALMNPRPPYATGVTACPPPGSAVYLFVDAAGVGKGRACGEGIIRGCGGGSRGGRGGDFVSDDKINTLLPIEKSIHFFNTEILPVFRVVEPRMRGIDYLETVVDCEGDGGGFGGEGETLCHLGVVNGVKEVEGVATHGNGGVEAGDSRFRRLLFRCCWGLEIVEPGFEGPEGSGTDVGEGVEEEQVGVFVDAPGEVVRLGGGERGGRRGADEVGNIGNGGWGPEGGIAI